MRPCSPTNTPVVPAQCTSESPSDPHLERTFCHSAGGVLSHRGVPAAGTQRQQVWRIMPAWTPDPTVHLMKRVSKFGVFSPITFEQEGVTTSGVSFSVARYSAALGDRRKGRGGLLGTGDGFLKEGEGRLAMLRSGLALNSLLDRTLQVPLSHFPRGPVLRLGPSEASCLKTL